MSGITIKDLFDLSHSAAGEYLAGFTWPWEALAGISDFILALGKTLPEDEYHHPTDWDGRVLEDVWVANDATVFKTAYLHGPCIIGHGTEVRQCAFIRGSALVGDNCVVGNSTELKNVILFDNVQVPHYNYVGDSILGYKAHMGAGSITSNVKSDKLPVVVKHGDMQHETARKKVGAMLGDRVEVGCNSVLNPGSIIGRDSSIYPTSCVRGVVPERSIWKDKDNIVGKE
ncbi:MAG: UDP-N-acetylglucosamine pyrophosphorylase [Ruminococcaceae bacterium]|nr:UDP-N-acetylglucosamine pyrophosphorylase [Oscillospiraceae bacterium]